MGLAIFGAAAATAVIWLMVLGRGLTYFIDEWDFINAAATTGYWHNVLKPHNGHPSIVPFSVYWALMHTVGLRRYWPYQLVLVLLDVLCGWLLFVLLRRKVHPAVAAAASAVLMLLGAAWQDLLWPFQIGFLGSVAGGLAALLLMDRDTRRSDIGACAVLVVSVGCSGVGLPFLVGVGVELLWRRRDWRRLWVPVFPFALFLVWYETIGRQSATSISLTTMFRTMVSATTATVGILAGRGTASGTLLACILAGLIVVVFLRSPGRACSPGYGHHWSVHLLGTHALGPRGLTHHQPEPLSLPSGGVHTAGDRRALVVDLELGIAAPSRHVATLDPRNRGGSRCGDRRIRGSCYMAECPDTDQHA